MALMSPLEREQKSILLHTAHRAAGGFYCGDSPAMQGLIRLGLMESAGRKAFVDSEYFQLTLAGQKVVEDLDWDALTLPVSELDQSEAKRNKLQESIDRALSTISAATHGGTDGMDLQGAVDAIIRQRDRAYEEAGLTNLHTK